MSFETPQETIDWAKSCLASAHKSFTAYVRSDAFAEVAEFDPKTREKVISVRLVNPIPAEVAGNLRTTLVDLKHSFDQSLFAAAQVSGCPRFDKTYPWADSPTGIKGMIARRQKEPESALHQFLIDEIFRHEPHGTGPGFPGGDNLIRDVAKLVNDKHTIGFKVSPSIGGIDIGRIETNGPVSVPLKWDPVKQEFVLARLRRGGNFRYENCAVAANIFFKRAGNIGKIPVFEAAEAFAKRAQFVLDGFKAVCVS